MQQWAHIQNLTHFLVFIHTGLSGCVWKMLSGLQYLPESEGREETP